MASSSMVWCVVLATMIHCVVLVVLAAPPDDTKRDGKFLNLNLLPFIQVSVRADHCMAKSDNASGTCTSTSDCTKEGGRADGTCGSSYSVCCIYQKRCGGVVRLNNTYLINDAFPEPVSSVDNCQYSIEKINNNVCQLRLDFETLKLQGPDNTTQCSRDTFTFTGTAGANPTVICGDNTGQHMYLDTGSSSGAARINIATTTADFERTWKILVTQIPCSSPSRSPPNCLQYYTEYSGLIKSYNYQVIPGLHQLANQQYSACIRTREGFCGIKYTADHFSLTMNGTGLEMQQGTEECKEDFIYVPVVTKDGRVGDHDRFCGSKLDEIITYSKPFEIRLVTNNNETDDETNNQGFSIRYTQIPC